jgi:hypothetical protein
MAKVQAGTIIMWGAIIIAIGLTVWGIIGLVGPEPPNPNNKSTPPAGGNANLVSPTKTQPEPPFVTPGGSGSNPLSNQSGNSNLSPSTDTGFDPIGGAMPQTTADANAVMQSSWSTPDQIAAAEQILGLTQPVTTGF